MRRLFTCIGIAALVAYGGQARATNILESGGELSEVLTCFYECKARSKDRPHLWKEVTTLMLANGLLFGPSVVQVVISDDDENIIAWTRLELTPLDLDELYVCRTLWKADLPVPEQGLIEVSLLDFAGPPSVYGWVKNVLGRFNGRYPEPFGGGRQEVDDIAKTECRVTPESVTDPRRIDDKIRDSKAPCIEPLLIEGTGEPWIGCEGEGEG